MKTRLFLMIATAIGVISECKAQESYYVGAGLTLSNGYDADITDQGGYYVAGGFTSMLSEKAGYLGELQLIKERAKPFQTTKLNGTFMFRYYVVEKLSIDAGFQIGTYLAEDISDETNKLSKGGMDAVIGASFKISQKFSIQGRYNHHLSEGLPFNGFVQMGATYSLFSKD